MAIDDMKVFNIILKADVQGTAGALKASLENKNDEVAVPAIHYGVGGVTESGCSISCTAGAVMVKHLMLDQSVWQNSAEERWN